MAQNNCKNCGKPFEVPATAENKKFCCSPCRQSWHTAQRAEALEQLPRLIEARRLLKIAVQRIDQGPEKAEIVAFLKEQSR